LATKETLKKDKKTLKFLLKNELWDAMDAYLNTILESKDIKRYKKVLKVFKEHRDSKMFKSFLDNLERKIEEIKCYG
jgi:hypothetical protein